MPYTLTLPEVGETVTEGTIEKWLKAPGDKVAKYEPIVEVNTDKVNVELPSPVSGTVVEILVAEGETVPIGAGLCTIDEVPGETPAEIAPAAPSAEPKPAKELVAAAPRERADRGGPGRATPRVRRVAEELGVDLARVEGSGPGGRILEDDVRASAQGAPATVAEVGADEEAIPVSGIRRTIARRMSESAFTAPHAWLVVEADVTELVKLRADERDAFRERTGVDLTYLPFAAHAVSQALPDHPYLNASWAEDQILLKKRVNLGVAVATDRGLLVPVVKDADRLSVAGLALAMSELGGKARDKKLQLDDVQGGTFTLDNTGAFGSIVSMPIVNLGQAAIISLEMITRRPVVVEEDAIAVRDVVNLCLSFDHRILDGHQAGAFLGDVKSRLEAFGPGSDLE
ncbi:MAG: 2-oxo acid dehydrogenase subunit E2 [Chloroflexi bacterium]|nr:2-oxo acid dehydrogenase subunit E2 [Chloroflexota bacterium]